MLSKYVTYKLKSPGTTVGARVDSSPVSTVMSQKDLKEEEEDPPPL